MKTYKSHQFSWILIIVLLPILTGLFISYKYQLGNNPLSLVPMVILESFFLFLFLLFYRLKISLTKSQIMISYGIGLIKIRIQQKEIESTKLVRNHWYYGLGIRVIPNGILYNAHGLDAVELTFKGKRNIIRISSLDCKKLKIEIDKRLSI